MKIAVISNKSSLLITSRGTLLAEMVRRGHEVVAFAPDHSSQTRQELASIGVVPVDAPMSRAGTSPLTEWRTILVLRRLLTQHRPDICFAYVIKPVIYATIAAWLAGVRNRYGSIDGLGFAFTNASGKGRLLQAVISIMMRFATKRIGRLIFLNPDDLELFVSRGLVAREKTALLGALGVDLEEWRPVTFPEGPVTFILVARLLREKGIAEYVEAARLVKAKHPAAQFLLLGGLDENPGSFKRDEVESWVREGVLQWPGHAEVRPWIEKAHVFVLPSYREGVPQSTQEAMAMGRPVLTTDVPGCRETVAEGVNGYMVPPRDPFALAAAMSRFVEDTSLLLSMGRESRRIAEERFDVRTQSQKALFIMEISSLT